MSTPTSNTTPTFAPHTRSTLGPRLLLLTLLAATTLAAAGCQTPIMTPDEPRSQYDRNDAIRDKRQPQYTYDEFDRRRPNVRARLLNAR
jgi:hypothetical protein